MHLRPLTWGRIKLLWRDEDWWTRAFLCWCKTDVITRNIACVITRNYRNVTSPSNPTNSIMIRKYTYKQCKTQLSKQD